MQIAPVPAQQVIEGADACFVQVLLGNGADPPDQAHGFGPEEFCGFRRANY